METDLKNAKSIHATLQKEYGIKIPLEFKNLNGRGGGYVRYSRIKGLKNSKTPQKIVIDNSGRYCFEADYVMCHEFAHVIMILKHNSASESKKHQTLTTKLARQFNLI